MFFVDLQAQQIWKEKKNVMKKHHGTIAKLTFFKTVPNHVATASYKPRRLNDLWSYHRCLNLHIWFDKEKR